MNSRNTINNAEFELESEIASSPHNQNFVLHKKILRHTQSSLWTVMIGLRRKTAWNTKPSPSRSWTRGAAHKQCRSVYIAFCCCGHPLFASPRSNELSWHVPPGPNIANRERKGLTPLGETFEHEQQHGGKRHRIQPGETRALNRQGPAPFCSSHTDLPDVSGKLPNPTILLCKLFSPEGREHTAGETEWGDQQNQYSTRTTPCASFDSPHPLKEACALITLCQVSETHFSSRKTWSLHRGTPTASTLGRSVKPVLFVATKPWMDLSIPALETTCPAVKQQGCGVRCSCKPNDGTAGSRHEPCLVYGIQAGKVLPEAIS